MVEAMIVSSEACAPYFAALQYTEPLFFETLPAKAFWSLTMYDIESYLVPNELNRYTLGDRSDLNYAPDGSLTFYLQKDNPGKDKEANCLPVPAGPFRLALRLYVPKEEVINRRWVPAVERQK